MSRTFLFDSIRAHLKARGYTYRQLGGAIGVSEPTVKRILSTNDCTIERLEEICQFLNIELAQLVKSTPKKRKLIEQLTRKQETVLGACLRFCVNGLMAGDCRDLQRKRNDRKQRIDRPPAGGLQKA